MDTFFCLFSFSSPFSHYEKMMSKPPTDAIWTAHTTPLNKKRNTENKVELTSLLFTHQNHIENITNGAEKTGDIHFFSFYYIQWVFFSGSEHRVEWSDIKRFKQAMACREFFSLILNGAARWYNSDWLFASMKDRDRIWIQNEMDGIKPATCFKTWQV